MVACVTLVCVYMWLVCVWCVLWYMYMCDGVCCVCMCVWCLCVMCVYVGVWCVGVTGCVCLYIVVMGRWQLVFLSHTDWVWNGSSYVRLSEHKGVETVESQHIPLLSDITYRCCRCSPFPTPPPTLRDKIWEEAWEWGYCQYTYIISKAGISANVLM